MNEQEFLIESIDAANNTKRGRKADTAEFKRYKGYRSILADLSTERDRIKSNISQYGIGSFGKYAKSNKAQLANAASVVIGFGC